MPNINGKPESNIHGIINDKNNPLDVIVGYVYEFVISLSLPAIKNNIVLYIACTIIMLIMFCSDKNGITANVKLR